jgi:hypothetical protein
MEDGGVVIRRVGARRVAPTNEPTHVTHKRLLAQRMADLNMQERWGTGRTTWRAENDVVRMGAI